MLRATRCSHFSFCQLFVFLHVILMQILIIVISLLNYFIFEFFFQNKKIFKKLILSQKK